jgi:hypothetical protein
MYKVWRECRGVRKKIVSMDAKCSTFKIRITCCPIGLCRLICDSVPGKIGARPIHSPPIRGTATPPPTLTLYLFILPCEYRDFFSTHRFWPPPYYWWLFGRPCCACHILLSNPLATLSDPNGHQTSALSTFTRLDQQFIRWWWGIPLILIDSGRRQRISECWGKDEECEC